MTPLVAFGVPRGNATIFVFHSLSAAESRSRPDLHDIACAGNVVTLATVCAPRGGRNHA